MGNVDAERRDRISGGGSGDGGRRLDVDDVLRRRRVLLLFPESLQEEEEERRKGRTNTLAYFGYLVIDNFKSVKGCLHYGENRSKLGLFLT